MVNRILDFAK